VHFRQADSRRGACAVPDPEIQSADPRARRLLAWTVVIGMGAGAIAYALLQTWLADVVQLPPATARQKLLSALFWLIGIGAFSLAALGGYVWRVGAGIRAARRFPPPGSRVIRDTPVLLDAPAVHRGRAIQAAGVALVLCAIGLGTVLWRSLPGII
jgi:hypothetical protein